MHEISDIVGWTFEGAAYCLDHKPPDGCPIFANNPGWQDVRCNVPHGHQGDSLVYYPLGQLNEKPCHGTLDADGCCLVCGEYPALG